MNNSLRECVVEAADRLGSDGRGKDGVVGFLMTFGRRHPTHLLALLGKALPIEARTPAAEDERHFRSHEEIRAELAARGIGPEMLRLMADRMATPDADAGTRHVSNGSGDPEEIAARSARWI